MVSSSTSPVGDGGVNVKLTVPEAVALALRVSDVLDALLDTVVPPAMPVPATASPLRIFSKELLVVSVGDALVVVQPAIVIGDGCDSPPSTILRVSVVEPSDTEVVRI